MTLKILLDPILTSTPNRCSTTIQFYEFVRRVLYDEKRDDIFFYWVVPAYVEEEDFKWYPQHPQVRYLRSDQTKDRVRAYLTLDPKLEDWLAFNGETWDVDIVLTVRAGLVPLMRMIMNSPRDRRWVWTKQIWLIDEMPMVAFKTTVPQMIPGVQDRWTIEGYFAADKVWLCSTTEKPGIIQEARKWFAPSLVRTLEPKITNMVTAQFFDFRLKPPEGMFKKGGKQPFGLAYIGRMEKANNIEDVSKIMEKAWVLRGDNVKQIVCTVSSIVKSFDEELVDVRFPPREEFWQIARTELHAFIDIPKVFAFALSIIEPLMLGTPVITTRSPGTEELLGPTYPFYATGPSTVYAVFKMLYDDYEGQYAKFAEWHKNWFQPTYERRWKEDLLYPKLFRGLADFDQMMQDRKEELAVLENNEAVTLLAKGMKSGTETMFDTVRRLGKTGEMRMLADKTRDNDRMKRSITFSTSWNIFRVGLKLFHGYEDASVATGHLKLKAK